MNKRNSKFIKLWEKVIEKGKTKYIVKTTIFWSVSVTLISPFFKFLFGLELNKEKLIAAYDIIPLLIQFVVLIFGGILFSMIMWKMNSTKYHQLIGDNNE